MDTPRHNHSPIKMHHVNPKKVNSLKQRGDFFFIPHPYGELSIWIMLPVVRHNADGTRNFEHAAPARFSIGEHLDGKDWWAWDGNEEAPTLSPSLHAIGDWHGYVQNGELVEVSNVI